MRKYGTDHEDPIDYLKSHGISEAQFRIDNNGEIMETTGEGSPVVHTQGITYILGNNVNLRKDQEQIMV